MLPSLWVVLKQAQLGRWASPGWGSTPMVALTADSLCSTSACLSSASGSVTIGDARGWNDAFGVGLTAAYGINKLLHVPLNTSIIFKYGGTHTVFVADSEA